MEMRRSCYYYSWKAMPLPVIPKNNSITWCFVRGCQGENETLTETDYRKWRNQVSNGVENHCHQLGKFVNGYSVLHIVVIWGEDEDYLPHLLFLLQTLDVKIQELAITICLEKEPCSESGIRALKNIRDSVCVKSEHHVAISNLCLKLSQQEDITSNFNLGKLRLPGFDNAGEEGEVAIKEKDATWLNEELDVMYIDGTFPQKICSEEDQMREGQKFYQGGNLSWSAWYEKDVGYYDVKRDVMENLENEIKSIIESEKSAWITLCHAPASGGTTLVHRILMDFRKIIPCATLKRQPTSMIEFIEKLQMIYRETYKTILLVVDGEDPNWVRQLASCNKEIKLVVLYVQLYLAEINASRPPISHVFFLNGEVTKLEASFFGSKFGSQCATAKQKESVEQLAYDIETGVPRNVYEFGLTAFLNEFKGLEKYVRGYLHLENVRKLADLEPWQKALAYAALAFFYGHSHMPIQFFASMLNVPSNEVVELNDFKMGHHFLIHDNSDYLLIRICNFYVAREILNQVLTYRVCTEGNDNPFNINEGASVNLLELLLDFIDECKQKSVNIHIHKVLVKMFFFRDKSEPGESSLDTSSNSPRKHMLSRLLEAIPGDYPYNEREKLMLKISEAFSENALFQAHLGRFYYTHRPNDRQKAETALQRALEICESQTERTKEDKASTETTFVHVHHMYGMMYATIISHLAKKKIVNEQMFQTNLSEIIELARKAIMHFRESYRHMLSSGIYTDHPAVGEMRVRINVSEYILEYMKIRQGGLKEYLKDKCRNEDAVNFIRKTVPAIDFLIFDCCAHMDINDMSKGFFHYSHQYKVLHQHVPDMIKWVQDVDTISSRRFIIAVLKQKYALKYASNRPTKKITTLQDITNSEDIQTIVKHYEAVIAEARRNTTLLDKSEMERDMQEWLFAIRHNKFHLNYKVTNVLEVVSLWNKYRLSPLSQFYVFVLMSLLGLGTSETPGDTEYLIQAKSMVGKMLPKNYTEWVRKPRYPREWLGKNQNGIKRLISGSLIGNLDHNSQVTENAISKQIKELEVCRGTIRSPNLSRLHGEIELDFGSNESAHQVKVFYKPLQSKLVGRRFAGKRVDFYLAFSIEHGYTAAIVQELKTVKCSKCSTTVEESLKQDLACKSCKSTITAAKD